MKIQRIIMILLLLFVIVFGLVSCGVNQDIYKQVVSENEQLVNDKEKLSKEKEQLIKENEMLMKKLDELENNAERLLSKIKLYYEEKKYDGVKSEYENLKSRHFDSPEFQEASVIYNKVIETEKAEKEKQKLEEEKLKQQRLTSLNKLKKETDDVSGITWYRQSYFTHYNNKNLTSIYMGQKDDSIWLRLRMSFEGDNWIFFEHAYLSYEGNTIEIAFDEYDEKESDNNGGSVWEWIDVQVTNDILKFLRNCMNSPEAKMRLSGKYTKTRTLTENERKGIIDIINGYDALKDEL